MNKFLLFSLSAALLLTSCGDEESTNGTETTSINNKNISGVSQKGPFVTGSAVKLYETEDESLAPTGKSFPGKIASDDGKFSISNVSLVSPYALLEAIGYFRNEITGTKSSGTITLNALTNLSDREKVNINLLTHLEYERALYLVGTGVGVSEAKKQAESEILKAFAIEGKFENSEDLDIFSSGDGNAALLAFSVLMLRDLNEADLTEHLTKFATDIEQDGSWDDKATKTAIADWASSKSLEGGLAAIRDNITSWGLSDEVPDFEKYVNNFWWQSYGLKSCDKNRQGEVKASNNDASSKNGVHFICDNNAWRLATNLEKDTYKWEAGKDGDNRYGDILKTNCYVFEDKAWRSGNDRDCSLNLRGCTSLRQDTVGQGMDKAWYICDGKNWRNAEDIEKDTTTWGVGKFDGEIRTGQVNKDTYYIYETSNKAWRVATTLEEDTYDYTNNKDWANGDDGEIKRGAITNAVYIFDETTWRIADDVEKVLGGCIATIQDSVGKAGDSYYICNSRKWNVATTLQYDTYKQKCSEFGQVVHGNVNTDSAYFCYGEEWKKFYGNESITYGKLVDERDGQIYRTTQIGKQTWMAENLNFIDSLNYPSMRGRTRCMREGESIKPNPMDNSDRVECVRLYTWTAAIDSVQYFEETGKKCGKEAEKCGISGRVKGICPEGWHLPSMQEYYTLDDLIGGDGLKLKSKYTWEYKGTDVYGFSAIHTNSTSCLWDSYEDTRIEYVGDYFWFNEGRQFADSGANPGDFCAVRCIKDEE